METPSNPLRLPSKEEFRKSLALDRWEYIGVKGMLVNLGVLALQCGCPQVAKDIWGWLVSIDSNYAPAWYDLYSMAQGQSVHYLEQAARWDTSQAEDDVPLPLPPGITQEFIRSQKDSLKEQWQKEYESCLGSHSNP